MFALIKNDLVQMMNMFTKNRLANPNNIGGGINFVILAMLVAKLLKYVMQYL